MLWELSRKRFEDTIIEETASCAVSIHSSSLTQREVPGLGVDSAQQIIAEVGPTAATFPSEKCLSSWVGACPGDNESGGVNYSRRSPKGNRHMRRLLNQTANAEASSRLCIAARSRAWDTSKPSGQSLIDSVA
jgi:transposase